MNLAIHDGLWCATKSTLESEVNISKYDGSCGNQRDPKDPIITLNGEKSITLKAGEAYTDLGAIGKTVDGEILGYTTTITWNDNLVEGIDTNKTGVYQIIYQVKSNGKTATITRIVRIESGNAIEDIMRNSKDVMALDPDKNLRYVGGNPSNYVRFNNELWRIIGVFDGETKIVREEFYSAKVYFSGDYWGRSSIKSTFNTSYLEGIQKNDPESYQYIDLEYYWRLGLVEEITDFKRSYVYEQERGDLAKNYPGIRTGWKGAIGLIYLSDYGYATNSVSDACENNSLKLWYDSENSECSEVVNNWLAYKDGDQWTISVASPSSGAWTTYRNGQVHIYNSTNYGAEKPALYLKPEVKIISGEGTSSNPYILGM